MAAFLTSSKLSIGHIEGFGVFFYPNVRHPWISFLGAGNISVTRLRCNHSQQTQKVTLRLAMGQEWSQLVTLSAPFYNP